MNLTKKYLLVELTHTDKLTDLLDKVAGRIYIMEGVEGDVVATELTEEQVERLKEQACLEQNQP